MKNFLNQYGLYVATAVIIAAIFIGKAWYQAPKFGNGADAPDFRAQDYDNKPFTLYSTRGNLVLLDFWGSWCGPCRQESPELRELYKKYHGQTFDGARDFLIVSVGIERNRNAWGTAIAQDQLTWPYHVSSLKYFKDPVAELYGVKSIPSKYLINENMQIIAVNPTFGQLEELLNSRLKK